MHLCLMRPPYPTQGSIPHQTIFSKSFVTSVLSCSTRMEFSLFVGALFSALFCYTLYGAVYRLYLSSIASFPGPKLATLTLWYEFYYDVFLLGRYTWKLAELHEQYGPIIRISPYELHINDPDFYDELYVGASKRRSEIYDWTVRELDCAVEVALAWKSPGTCIMSGSC